MTPEPGYIDLQVNGYAGVDFNRDNLTAEQLHLACEALRRDGVAGILATIITDDLAAMQRRISRLVELRDADELAKQMILGIHIEGPFISPIDGYRGAHPKDAVTPADTDAMQRLLDSAHGLTRMVTLAPECDAGFKVTRLLADRGVIVAAGHTDASLDELRGAIGSGLRVFTHLGNGCPMEMNRHDNIVQRALSLVGDLVFTVIADGHHVPWFALGNYVRAAGAGGCVVVSDAISAAGLGPGRYTLGRWEVEIGDDLAARAPDGSHLVGSAVTMKAAAAGLGERLGLSGDEVGWMTRGGALGLLGLGS